MSRHEVVRRSPKEEDDTEHARTAPSAPIVKPGFSLQSAQRPRGRCSSGGAPWERLGGGLPQPLDYMAYALVTDPGAAGHLYAGLASGHVWHSADYGDSWQRLPFQFDGIQRAMIII